VGIADAVAAPEAAAGDEAEGAGGAGGEDGEDTEAERDGKRDQGLPVAAAAVALLPSPALLVPAEDDEGDDDRAEGDAAQRDGGCSEIHGVLSGGWPARGRRW